MRVSCPAHDLRLLPSLGPVPGSPPRLSLNSLPSECFNHHNQRPSLQATIAADVSYAAMSWMMGATFDKNFV